VDSDNNKEIASDSRGKGTAVAQMFDKISWRYDFLNHFLSFNIDKRWRNKAVKELRSPPPPRPAPKGKEMCENSDSLSHSLQLDHVLDVATGTADLALTIQKLIKPKHITGIDISEGMLAIGRKKIEKKGLEQQITLQYGNSEDLLFDEQTFDAVTVAFGVRNFEHLEKGLNEMYRTLKSNGKVVILEFSIPKNRIIRPVFQFYFSRILPFFGRLFSKDSQAYKYLPESVQSFPHGTEFKEIMEKCGFSEVKIIPLTCGIVNVYTGIRGEE